MEGKITIGNVCFILNEETQKILLLKRNRDPMKGLITGVGGKTNFIEDIPHSCIREIKEETGIEVEKIILKGIVKTLLHGENSSWIIFVYVAKISAEDFIECAEGKLFWVDKDKIFEEDLIGFIKKILPYVLDENKFIEAIILHDMHGNVLSDNMTIHNMLLYGSSLYTIK